LAKMAEEKMADEISNKLETTASAKSTTLGV
jgi:hypothetical protein